MARGPFTVTEEMFFEGIRETDSWFELVDFALEDRQCPYVYSNLKRSNDEYLEASCLDRNRSKTELYPRHANT